MFEEKVIEYDALPNADESRSDDVAVSDGVDESAKAKAYANSEDAVHPQACGRGAGSNRASGS